MSLRPESLIFIDTQLVWMTCGVDAGYQLLLAPPTTGTPWVDLIEQAFPNFELGSESLRSATVAYESGQALAVAFFDPVHRDASSRPIKHFMLWLDANDAALQKVQQLAIPPLLQQLEPAFAVILQASRYASEQEICRAAKEKQRERNLRLTFTAKKPSSKPKAKPVMIQGQDLDSDDKEALVMPRWLLTLLILSVVSAIAAALWLSTVQQ
jgi:hypothetical protein